MVEQCVDSLFDQEKYVEAPEPDLLMPITVDFIDIQWRLNRPWR